MNDTLSFIADTKAVHAVDGHRPVSDSLTDPVSDYGRHPATSVTYDLVTIRHCAPYSSKGGLVCSSSTPFY